MFRMLHIDLTRLILNEQNGPALLSVHYPEEGGVGVQWYVHWAGSLGSQIARTRTWSIYTFINY